MSSRRPAVVRTVLLAAVLGLAACSSAPRPVPGDTEPPVTDPAFPSRPTEFTVAIEAAKAIDRAVRALAEEDGAATPRAARLLERAAASGTFAAFGAGRDLVVWGLTEESTPVAVWDRTTAIDVELAASQTYLRIDVPGASACLRLGADPSRHIENAPAIDGELAEDPKASAVVSVTADTSACAAFWPA